MDKNKKIAAAVSLVLLIGGIWWYYQHRHYIPKDSAEFFRRNPHLHRPISRMSIPSDQLREDDKFREGDYQLLADHVYPVEFSNLDKFSQLDQPEQQFESKGSVILKSLGLMKGRLVVLAEFKFSKAKEMKKMDSKMLEELGILANDKKKPTQTQILKSSLLVKLDPRGIVRELYVADKKVSQVSLTTRLQLLDQIFKQVVVVQPGNVTQTKIDQQGYPYQMRYDIKDEGQIIRIKATSGQDFGMNQTESKAAAAGAQGMGQFSVLGKQLASMDWQWLKSEQRPKQQDSKGEVELRLKNQLVAFMSGNSTISWGETSKDDSIKSTAELFNFPINVSILRSVLKQQQQKVLNQNKQTIAKSDNKSQKLTDKERRNQAYDAMADALKNNPEKIPAYRQMALNAAPGSDGLNMILGALGYEGSPDSQKVLVEVYARPNLADTDRQKILTELVLADQALDPEVKKFLRNEFEKEDFINSKNARTAGLALGASISLDGDPETISYLHDQWDDSKSRSKNEQEKRSRQMYLLKVMGNSKSDVFMSEAQSMSSSSNPDMRAVVADSIRFSQSPDSRDLLFDLLRDRNPEVRTLVVQALRYQPFDTRTQTALQNCTGDADTGVKLNCYRMLAVNISQPGIREYLSSRAGSESDPQVKRTLTEALSEEGKSSKQ